MVRLNFSRSVLFFRFQSCVPFSPLCYVINVPIQNFSFRNKIAPISGLKQFSVLLMTSTMTNRIFETDSSEEHSSRKFFTILQDGTFFLMCDL